MVDCLRYDSLGVSPEKDFLKKYRVDHLLETPTLDTLAEEGVFFSQSTTAATQTVPSMAATFTGCWGPVHGVRAHTRALATRNVTTIWEIFSNSGYDTIAYNAHPFTVYNNTLKGCRMRIDPEYSDDNWWVKSASSIGAKKQDFQFLRTLETDIKPPFAAYVHIWDVHSPYLISAWPFNLHQNYFKHVERALKVNGLPPIHAPFEDLSIDQLYRIWFECFGAQFGMGFAHPVEVGLPMYIEGISAFDQGRLAHLLKHLKRRGLLDNTIIVLFADHGECAGHEPYGPLTTFYHGGMPREDLMRTPLLMHAPGMIPQDKIIPQQVSNVDILPTLIDLCGLERPDTPICGRSLTGLMSGSDQSHSTAYCEFGQSDDKALKEAAERGEEITAVPYYVRYRAVRTPEYKYMEMGEDLTDEDMALPDPEFVGALQRKYLCGFESAQTATPYLAELENGRITRDQLIAHMRVESMIRGRYRLFDLQADPGEQVNLLALDPDTSDPVAKPLRDKLHEINDAGTEHSDAGTMEQYDDAEAEQIHDRLRGLGYID